MSIERIIELSDLLEKEIVNTSKDLHWFYQGLNHKAYYGGDSDRAYWQNQRRVCWLNEDLSHKSSSGRRIHSCCEVLPPIGSEFHCRFCGVWYSALWRKEVFTSNHRDSITRKLIRGSETRYYLGDYTYLQLEIDEDLFPVCSTECYEALNHIFEAYEAKVKQEELEKAERTKELLKIVKKFELRQTIQERKIKQWEPIMTSLQASLIP